jgi:hypothetical protein
VIDPSFKKSMKSSNKENKDACFDSRPNDKKGHHMAKPITKSNEYYKTFYHKPTQSTASNKLINNEKPRNTAGAISVAEQLNPFTTIVNQF